MHELDQRPENSNTCNLCDINTSNKNLKNWADLLTGSIKKNSNGSGMSLIASELNMVDMLDAMHNYTLMLRLMEPFAQPNWS